MSTIVRPGIENPSKFLESRPFTVDNGTVEGGVVDQLIVPEKRGYIGVMHRIAAEAPIASRNFQAKVGISSESPLEIDEEGPETLCAVHPGPISTIAQ